MPRIAPVDPANADPKAQQLLEGVQKSLGVTPNLMKTMAQSPAVLGAYLGFGQALGGASIGGALREQIALTVAGANRCTYCASAHTALATGLGVGEGETGANLKGESSDPKTAAALAFAKAIVERQGFVSDADLDEVRAAGFADQQITEIIATVALNIFTNYFNHVARTVVDFPRVEVGEPVPA